MPQVGRKDESSHGIETLLKPFFTLTTSWFDLLLHNQKVQSASLVAQRVKSLPAMLETRVRSLGWEDPLEKKMATQAGTLA